jgi:hypothetical protein
MEAVDMSRNLWLIVCLIGLLQQLSSAAVYQWSVEIDQPAAADSVQPRAYLWIAPDCQRVRAVVVGQHNMLEEDILEHPEFRKAMGELGIAIVWITPAMDGPFDPDKSGDRFKKMMKDLAAVSGYQELEFAPIAPIGHSAAASYPWNFAAWAPQRTLAALSIHGDAPETPLAGFGRPNANWGDRNIDGVPGLMVMGEYEWIEARLAPAMVYRAAHPKAVIAMLAEPGQGHFAACDDLVRFLTMFLRKCVEQRLPAIADTPLDRPVPLTPIDPSKGWLVERRFLNTGRIVQPGPFGKYEGDSVDAFWAFDEEMAMAIQNYHADQIGKRPQLIGFVQNGQIVPAVATHPMENLKFLPMDDGETLKIEAKFLDTVSSMGPDKDGPGKNNHVRWTGLAAGSPIGHANGGGPIQIHRIEGPIEQIAPDTFKLSFYRGASFSHPAIWLCATHPGDDQYKSAVQQAVINLSRNDMGADQTITFEEIADQKVDGGLMKLSASSSARLPVHFFVREGPAEVEGETLKLLSIPSRAKYPVKVTIVAWQWGREMEPRVKTAAPVERTFSILGPS